MSLNALVQKNRREYLRIVPFHEAPVHVDINGAGIIEMMHAMDIGEGGIALRVRHQFKGSNINEPVSFIVRLPAPVNQYFRADGRIIHVRSELFGVQFINLEPKARDLIRRYIASMLKQDRWWDYFRYRLRLIR